MPDKYRKKRVRKHVIADMSFHHLAYIIVSCAFTVEPTKSDYGYDLSVFTFDGSGSYENGNVFVQLKATDNITIDKKSGDIKFRISKRDIETWEEEPFPVYLVVFDATARKAYSVCLQPYFVQKGIASTNMLKSSVIIHLPCVEIDEATIRGWRDSKNTVLTQMKEKVTYA